MVDKIYQESLANIFDGALEIIMLKTQKIRFFNESGIQQQFLKLGIQEDHDGATLYRISKELREFQITFVFDQLIAQIGK